METKGNLSISNPEWIWLPHAGHFICADKCLFRLCTYVNGYIVSTVGEMMVNGHIEKIGSDRHYETMVFSAIPSNNKCCPYVADYEKGYISLVGYNSSEEATFGHFEQCCIFEKKVHGGN